MKNKALKAFLMLSILLMIASACSGDTQSTYSSATYGEMRFTHVSGFYISQACLDGLFQHVDHVVRVLVIDERTELINTWLTPENLARYGDDLPEMYMVSTINTIQILEVFNGTREVGQITEVTQLGGQFGDTYQRSSFYVPLTVGDEFILFLHNCDLFDDYESRPLQFGPPSQSAYFVSSPTSRNAISQFTDDINIVQAYELGLLTADESFVSVNASNELVLTIGDLVRLADSTSSNGES